MPSIELPGKQLEGQQAPKFTPKPTLADYETENWVNRYRLGYRSWTIGLAAVGVSLMALALLFTWMISSSPSRNPPRLAVEKEEDSVSLNTSAERLLRAYYAESSPEGRIALIRNPKVSGTRLLTYHDGSPIKPLKVSWVSPISKRYAGEGNRGEEMITLNYRIEGSNITKTAAFENGQDGMKIDWESLVHYEPLSMPSFLSGGGTEATYRLVLKRDDYYNFEFASEKEFACFQMRTSRSAERIFGYARRGSAAERELNRLLERATNRGETMIRPTLRVTLSSRAFGAFSPQVLISEVVSKDWLVSTHR